MDSSWDTIIVGAGIAGACAAVYCSRHARTLLIEAEAPAAGASGASAGLVNPFMGRRARPVWRREEALEALSETLTRGKAGDFFLQTSVLRIPSDESLREVYRARHAEYPEETVWLSSEQMAERHPGLTAPYGALRVENGGAVRVAEAIERLLAAARTHGLHLLAPSRVTAYGEERQRPYVLVDDITRLYARRIVLAIGAGFHRFRDLQKLNLRGVKGQTVTVARPAALESVPCVSGSGYIAPAGEHLVLGSTYEHEYTDARPRSELTETILGKVSRMAPSLARAPVIGARAGIRVMTPQTNKAMIGPLPEYENIWFFGGLGSKALLMAPMMARRLPRWFNRPGEIPAALRPDSTRTTQK